MTFPDQHRRAMMRAGLLPFLCAPLAALAQGKPGYPTKPVRIVVGTPPGSGTDTNARFLVQKLGLALKQPFVVDNKPGAHGQLALAAVKNADPDGYTLLFAAGGTMAINQALHCPKFAYYTLRDFDPIVGLERAALYLAVNRSLPIKNVQEMIAYAKSHPNEIDYGTGGAGTTSHIAMEILKRRAGIQMTHVPYRGSAMVIQDLIGARIKFAFDAAAVMIPQAAQGTVRLIGIASSERSKVLPDVPTVAEQGFPGFEASTWSGLYAPKGSPPSVISVLTAAVNAELKSSDFIKKQEAIGSSPLGGSSADFRKLIEQQVAHWTAIVKETGIKAD
jgi:tripartite-type tricarboxylate transporter receptor subunit TctC